MGSSCMPLGCLPRGRQPYAYPTRRTQRGDQGGDGERGDRSRVGRQQPFQRAQQPKLLRLGQQAQLLDLAGGAPRAAVSGIAKRRASKHARRSVVHDIQAGRAPAVTQMPCSSSGLRAAVRDTVTAAQ